MGLEKEKEGLIEVFLRNGFKKKRQESRAAIFRTNQEKFENDLSTKNSLLIQTGSAVNGDLYDYKKK